MIAPIVNAIVILVCSLLGMAIGQRFKESLSEEIMTAIALAVLMIGISTALEVESTINMVVSLVLGVLIGNTLDLEEKFQRLGEIIKRLVVKDSSDDNKFVEGFVSSTLIFCIGSMAILGSIQAGISNDYTILFTKSILDGITAMILATTLGIGVAFSGITVFIYEGVIVLFSRFLKGFFTETLIANISGVGGVMIMALGLNMLKTTKIKTANMLPAILVTICIELISNLF